MNKTGKLNKCSQQSCLHASATFMFKHIPSLVEQHKETKTSVHSDKMGIGKLLSGCDFYLSFFPGGDGRSSPDHCAMYLQFVHCNKAVKFNVSYSITLMSNGRMMKDQHWDDKVFGYDPEDEGYDDDVQLSWGSADMFSYSSGFARDIKTLVVNVSLEISPFQKITDLNFLIPMQSNQVNPKVFHNQFEAIENHETDVVRIKIKDEPEMIVKCSKRALCCSSETFNTKLSSLDWKKDEKYDYAIKGHEPKLINKFLSFLQSGSYINLDDYDSIQELLKLLIISDEYLVTWMKDDVTNKIIPWMCIENAVECLVAADDAHCARLSDASINFCYQNYADLSITNEWAMIRKERPHLVISVLEEFSKNKVKTIEN